MERNLRYDGSCNPGFGIDLCVPLRRVEAERGGKAMNRTRTKNLLPTVRNRHLYGLPRESNCLNCTHTRAVKFQGAFRLRCRVKQCVVAGNSPECPCYIPGLPFVEEELQ